jgi:hypothetical protein
MPQSCPHFKLLQDRLDELTLKFMKDQVDAESLDPTGFTPDLDKLAAFRLLIHGEIEDFLEAKAKDNVAAISARISSNSSWMRQSPELLAVAIALRKALPEKDHLEQAKFAVFVSELLSSAKSAIKDNNGVKTPSFVLLSLLSGKTIDEIDDVLSNSLNSYGKNRGDVAHKSVTRSTTLNLPSTELATAQSLVQEIAKFHDVCR